MKPLDSLGWPTSPPPPSENRNSTASIFGCVLVIFSGGEVFGEVKQISDEPLATRLAFGKMIRVILRPLYRC